jgi:hypothetical protein
MGWLQTVVSKLADQSRALRQRAEAAEAQVDAAEAAHREERIQAHLQNARLQDEIERCVANVVGTVHACTAWGGAG